MSTSPKFGNVDIYLGENKIFPGISDGFMNSRISPETLTPLDGIILGISLMFFLLYSFSVKSIFNNKYFWEIRLDNGETIEAKSIILTCPFPQLKKIASNYLEKKISNL